MKNHECSPNIIHAHVCECWIEEYHRLKRMEENVKNAKIRLQDVIPTCMKSLEDKCKFALKVLESLDK